MGYPNQWELLYTHVWLYSILQNQNKWKSTSYLQHLQHSVPVLFSAVLKCRVTYTNLAKLQELLNKYCNLYALSRFWINRKYVRCLFYDSKHHPFHLLIYLYHQIVLLGLLPSDKKMYYHFCRFVLISLETVLCREIKPCSKYIDLFHTCTSCV